jgi:hypothetical protein
LNEPSASTGGAFQNLDRHHWAGTRTDTLKGDSSSYRAQFNYNADRYGFIFHRLYVGRSFNPETGFLYRSDISKYFSQVRFSPRPRRIRAIRKLTYQASLEYFDNATSGRLETADTQGQFAIDFQNSDNFKVIYDDWYERLVSPFAIASGVTVPIGGYSFNNLDRVHAGAAVPVSAPPMSSAARSGTETAPRRPERRPDLAVIAARHRAAGEPRSCHPAITRDAGELLHLVHRAADVRSGLVQYNPAAAVARTSDARMTSWQRAVRRLQRGARHFRAASRAAEPPLW